MMKYAQAVWTEFDYGACCKMILDTQLEANLSYLLYGSNRSLDLIVVPACMFSDF